METDPLSMQPETTVVNGKKFVPLVLVGFVLFTIVGLYGTYLVAQVIHPLSAKEQMRLRDRSMEQLKAHDDASRD